jgi:hypothetical protein
MIAYYPIWYWQFLTGCWLVFGLLALCVLLKHNYLRLCQWLWNWIIVPLLIVMIVGDALLIAIKHKYKRAK